jgi:hypothetical protein
MLFASLSAPADALAAVLRIAAVGVALASAELLAMPQFTSHRGLLAPDVALTRQRWLVVTRWRPLMARLFGTRGTTLIVSARLASALVIIVAPGGLVGTRWAVFVVAAATLLLRVRTPNATHAAGSMGVVVFLAAAGALAIDSSRAMTIALWFIAAQAWLSYFVAGASKLGTEAWRRGTAIPVVLSTVMWGNRRSAVLLSRHRGVALLLCWLTMLGECSIVLTLVVPLPIALALLAVALAFHVITAVEMGLNGFVWMFPSTYPAIVFCWYFVHGVPH